MTEHCNHECVCPEYGRQQDELNIWAKGKPCQNPSEMGKCNNDTRSLFDHDAEMIL